MIKWQSIRFTTATDEYGQTIKWSVSDAIGNTEHGDFVAEDLYIFAELISEYAVNLVSCGFYTVNIEAHEACRIAAKNSGIEFVCTAG